MPRATTERAQEEQGILDAEQRPDAPGIVIPERSSPVDGRVVQAAREGREGALERLVQQAYPLVRRWTAAHGAEPWEVDEVAQDVMILVVRRLESFRGDARFTTWLYRIARNVWLDRRKTRARTELVGEGADRAGGQDTGAATSCDEDPAGVLERKDTRDRVTRAFEALPHRQRQVFDLADLQGFTSPEIAEMLDVEPSTVRVTLLKARRALRKRLMEMDPDLAEGHGP
jgi:RNA polymerase sigma-70 factor (ECF subfamily)